MRTFPYVVVSAALLAACASSRPPPPPEAGPPPPPPPAAEEGAQTPVAPDVPAGAEAARIAEFSRQATPFVDAFVNSEALFTRDGKQVLFISSRDGLPQVYRADAASPTSQATRLFESKERVTLIDTTPDGRSLLVFSDKGADENWSVWKVGLDGSAPVELTPGETLSRDTAFLPDLAPDTLYIGARRMDEVASAAYAVPAAGGPSRVIYRDDKPGFLVHVSRDGKQGLFARYLSASENYLLHLDMASGKTRPLYPAQGTQVSLFSAQFSPDGRTVYVSTDGGGEQALVLALDSASGKELARYVEKDPAKATIQTLLVAKTGDTLALGLSAGNRSEVRLLDARTLKPRARVELPLGQGSPQAFSEDGRRLTAIWSTPASITDAWVIDVKTGKASPLRQEPRPALKQLPALETSIVDIRAHDGLALPTNVYLPKQRSGKLPVIVSYHGGPAGNSKIKWSAATAFFVSQGYAWVEPNVRGSSGFGRAFEEADNGAGRLEAFKDIEAVGRWAASQPWADPDRVIIYGGSYGGYTVLIGLTRMPDLWRAGVDVFGVANMKTFMATTSGFIREVFLLEFGDPDKDAAFLESISPLKDVARIADPLFVYAGANDPRVPRGESDQIVRALRERQVPVEYMVAGNEGHSMARRENQIEFMARTARFLEAHAGPREAAAP
ncbi:S9 family peptidase [Stigmatella hybrida]|uniref:S9 family peptidase n=1 Tax=Stigmatella hybrida TaxID=394097 RepID=UPI001CDA938C|nr:S9 family peptidase [Stigmatella hybrida]